MWRLGPPEGLTPFNIPWGLGSLLVQWFELRALTTGAWALPLAWEPRSHKLRGEGKKEKKRKEKQEQYNNKEEKTKEN